MELIKWWFNNIWMNLSVFIWYSDIQLFPLYMELTLNGVLQDFVQEGDRDKRVPVTTTWRVLRLRVEERSPIWRVAANILNMQTRSADKGWSSRLGFGRDADNSSP
jgi:hypothetical protein